MDLSLKRYTVIPIGLLVFIFLELVTDGSFKLFLAGTLLKLSFFRFLDLTFELESESAKDSFDDDESDSFEYDDSCSTSSLAASSSLSCLTSSFNLSTASIFLPLFFSIMYFLFKIKTINYHSIHIFYELLMQPFKFSSVSANERLFLGMGIFELVLPIVIPFF